MINEEFMTLTKEEKQAKFKAVLKAKTKDCLSDDEIRSILLMVPAKRQCSVFVYSDATEFSARLTVQKPRIGRTVFGQVLVGTADLPGRLFCAERTAAVMMRTVGNDDFAELHIYIPAQIKRKERCSDEQQGLEKASCL